MIGYDLNEFGMDDPDVRMSVQEDTGFALGLSIRSTSTPAPRGGNVTSSAGVPDARDFTLSVMIYGSSDMALDARYRAFMRLVRQPVLTLGRTVDGVRTVAQVKLVSVQQKPEYMPQGHLKTSVIVSMEQVYWRDAEFTTAELPVGTFDLVELADSSAEILDAKILVPGAADPLRSFSLQDDSSGTGIAWAAPEVEIGDYLGTIEAPGQVRDIVTLASGVYFALIVPSDIAQQQILRRFNIDGSTEDYLIGVSGYSPYAAMAIDQGETYLYLVVGHTLTPSLVVSRFVIATETMNYTFITGAASYAAVDVEVDAAGGIYVTDGTGTIRKWNAAGDAQTSITTIPFAFGIARTGANLWVVGHPSSGGRPFTLYKIDVSGTIQGQFVAAALGYRALATPVYWPRLSTDPAGVPHGVGQGVIYRYADDYTGTVLASWGSQGSGEGQLPVTARIGFLPNNDVIVADSLNNRITRFDGDGVFNGIAVGKWLLIDCGNSRATIVSTADYDASGDLISGLSSVGYARRYTPTSRPTPSDYVAGEMPATVTQTGGDLATIRAKRAYT